MLDELDVGEDPGPPEQAPTLSWFEEKRLRASLAWREDLEWLMLPECDELDPEKLLREILRRPDWHERAACRGADPELFFPQRGGGRPDEALAYCEQCPVRSRCLDSALEFGGDASVSGVWGGTTALGRREVRRRNRSVA